MTRPPTTPGRSPRRWTRWVAVVGTLVIALVGWFQWRHVENVRTDRQLETFGVTVLREDPPPLSRARTVSGESRLRWVRGLWGSAEVAGTPEEFLGDLRAATDAASLDPPFCVVPTERNHGIIRTVDHTLLDATYICEVSRGRQHWGRVVVRVREDGSVEVTFAVGPRSMVPRIRQHFIDDEPVVIVPRAAPLGWGTRDVR